MEAGLRQVWNDVIIGEILIQTDPSTGEPQVNGWIANGKWGRTQENVQNAISFVTANSLKTSKPIMSC